MALINNVGQISRFNYNEWIWKLPETYISHNKACISSPSFSFEEETWNLVIIPSNGYGCYAESGMNMLSLFLWNKSRSTPGQEYSVELGLKDINGGTFCSHIGSTISDYGFGKSDLCEIRTAKVYCCYQRLLKIFCVIRKNNESNPNDGLVLNEEPYSMENEKEVVAAEKKDVKFEKSEDKDKETYGMEIENEVLAMAKDGKSEKIEDKGVHRLVRNFRDLLHERWTSDLTIKVQNREFYVHRIILFARLPEFESIFRHEMSEKTSGVVDIPDCTSEAFEVFLQYLYTGSADAMSPDNVMNLYYTADKYRVDDLKAECAEFIERTLSLDNICSVISLSLRHDDSGLLNAAKKYFCKNVKKIIETVQWHEYLIENPVHANELFKLALFGATYN